jgi:hypothetical protein
MKVASDKSIVSFQPVHVTIQLESQEEVDLLGSLFNHSVVVDTLQSLGLDLRLIRDSLHSHGDCGRFITQITKGIVDHPIVRSRV